MTLNTPRAKKACILALIGALTLLPGSRILAGASDLPAALGLVPPNAPMTIFIPSLSGLSRKVARLNEEALGSAVPQMTDLLGMLKQMAGITDGLNDDGALMMIFTDAQMFAGEANFGHEPPLVILAPVSDYAAFVANFGGQGAEAVTTLTPRGGKPAYAKAIAGYAVIGPTREIVESFQPAQGGTAMMSGIVGQTGGRCLATADAAIITNVQAMEPVVRPKVQAELAKIMETALREMANEPPGLAELVESVLTMYFDTINAMLRDTSSVVIGADLSGTGVGLTYTAHFKPDSFLGSVIKQGGSAAGHLARLPNQKYMIATAMDMRGLSLDLLVDQLMARLPKVEDDPQIKPFVEIFEQAAQMMRQMKGGATVYSLPDGPLVMGQGFLSGVGVYETTDGQAYAATVRSYMEGMPRMLDVINKLSQVTNSQIKGGFAPPAGHGDAPPPAPPAPAGMTATVEYNAGVMDIDGISVDQYKIQYQIPPAMMQEMGPAAPIMMMFMGGSGQSGYIAVKDQFVVMTMTPDAQLLRETLASLGRGNGLGSDGPIEQTRRTALQGQEMLEAYLSVPGLIGTVNAFMAMMGQQPIEAPQDLPPLALGYGIEGHGVSMRLYVPTKVIRFCKDTATNIMGMMGGGQQGPDGLGPDDDWGPDDEDDDWGPEGEDDDWAPDQS